MTLAGYWLGRIPLISENFELTVLAIVLLSLLPVFLSAWRHHRQRRTQGLIKGAASRSAACCDPAE
jgi:hypothetical protein